MKISLAALSLSFAFLACTSADDGNDQATDGTDAPDDGDGGDDPGTGDDGSDPGDDDGTDGSDDGSDDGASPGDGTVCLTGSNAATAGTAEGFVSLQEEGDTGGPLVVELSIGLAGESDEHFLVVELWEEFGEFEDGIVPGTYEIGGLETELFECSVCVYIESDALEDEFLMAEAGTVQVSEVGTQAGDLVSVTLTGLSFRQIEIDDAAETESEVAGGCTAELASATLEATLMAD